MYFIWTQRATVYDGTVGKHVGHYDVAQEISQISLGRAIRVIPAV